MASYTWKRWRARYLPSALEVLTLDAARVKDITAFVYPELLPRFSLPAKR
ncbi:MAG: hypothetical protein U0R69_00920 [Gaiellales bacterium]